MSAIPPPRLSFCSLYLKIYPKATGYKLQDTRLIIPAVVVLAYSLHQGAEVLLE